MSLWQTWDNYLTGFSEDAASFTQQVSQQIVNKQCQLYSKYPNTLSVFPLYRGILNNVCSQFDPGFTPPDTPGFLGGQCVGVQYNVYGIYQNANETFGPCDAALGWFVLNTPGPVVGIRPNGGGNQILSGGGPVITTIRADPSGNLVGLSNTCAPPGGLPAPAMKPNTSQITRIERVDGLPDDCGNPPPPVLPEPPIDGDDFFTTIVINNRDPSDNSIIDIIGINAPITINADIDFKLTFDVGGINFNLGSDGIGNDAEGADTSDDGGGGGGTVLLPPPNSDDYEEEEKAPSDGEEETISINIAYITLELIDIPANAKTQWGRSGPDVIYAGWFEFRTEGFFYPRQPVHFSKNIYIPPRGATGYAYTLYEGFSGRIRTYEFRNSN